MIIETKNLRLIPCDKEILVKAIEGNDKLEKMLNIKVADNWTEFGVDPFQFSLDRISEDMEEIGWLTYFPIHKQDNKLIGSAGYKGKPNENGSVEIGYEIAPHYRNKGFATEMAEALISNAFSDIKVKLIIAHTLREENASAKILTKCGFIKVGDIDDPDDGPIWKWELKKS
ncbi:MAG: GNAT family N-acetyltransferase [Saprospiraceae bacterium]|nr:GNAT family N-acetyltransferase [Saprospiraceae bacterium]